MTLTGEPTAPRSRGRPSVCAGPEKKAEILALLAQGMSGRKVATTLGLSKSAVHRLIKASRE